MGLGSPGPEGREGGRRCVAVAQKWAALAENAL